MKKEELIEGDYIRIDGDEDCYYLAIVDHIDAESHIHPSCWYYAYRQELHFNNKNKTQFFSSDNEYIRIATYEEKQLLNQKIEEYNKNKK